MKSKLLLVIPTLLLSTTLAACGAQSGAPPHNPAQLVVVGQDAVGVAAVGRGEVVATPDTGFIDVGIETHGPSIAAARGSGAKAMNAVIDAVVENGVARADIQTSQLSLSPRYDYEPKGGAEPRINGYTMTTSVSVKVRDLDKLSKIVDDAASAGGNASRVSGIRFTIDNPSALRDRAREAAVADARRKAEQLAKVSGGKLGALVGIEEVSVSAPVPMMMLEAANDAVKTPIERGSATVSIEVKARWAIAG